MHKVEFINDYDFFEVGETWYLKKEEGFYVGENGKCVNFNEGAELEIVSISKESNYGKAEILMEGYQFEVGLDELYDMVFPE